MEKIRCGISNYEIGLSGFSSIQDIQTKFHLPSPAKELLPQGISDIVEKSFSHLMISDKLFREGASGELGIFANRDLNPSGDFSSLINRLSQTDLPLPDKLFIGFKEESLFSGRKGFSFSSISTMVSDPTPTGAPNFSSQRSFAHTSSDLDTRTLGQETSRSNEAKSSSWGETLTEMVSRVSEAYCNSEIARNTTSGIAGGLAATALVTNPAGIAGIFQSVVVADAVGRTVTNVIDSACGGPVKGANVSEGVKTTSQVIGGVTAGLLTRNIAGTTGVITSAVSSTVIEKTVKDLTCAEPKKDSAPPADKEPKESPPNKDSKKSSSFSPDHHPDNSGHDCGIRPRPTPPPRFSPTETRFGQHSRFTDPAVSSDFSCGIGGKYGPPPTPRFASVSTSNVYIPTDTECGNTIKRERDQLDRASIPLPVGGEEIRCATTTKRPLVSYPHHTIETQRFATPSTFLNFGGF